MHAARPISFALVVASLTFGQNARAQDHATDPRVANAINLLERWLDAQHDYHQIPGISAAVVYDQEVIWSKGFGYADLESMRPATPSTLYSICSISKLFTSVGVMQLRDKGKFRLDDEVAAILPWFEIEQSHPGSPPVTVEGILTHSAGLPREAAFPYWTDPFDFPTHDDVVAHIASQETLYPAWQYFQYSNLGLTLAGEIVAQASGQPYSDYVTQHVLAPLGMSATRPEIGDVQGTQYLATGYSATRRDGTREVVEPFAGRGIAPAMGYASSVEDLAKFASWQFRLLEDGGHEILDANTLREMQRVHYIDPNWRTTWGLGFSVWRSEDKTFRGHGGSCPGHRSHLLLRPEDKIATIAMANAMISPNLFTRRAYELLAPALKEAKEAPSAEDWTPEELNRYVGVYDAFPWGGESQVIPWKGSIAVVSFPTDNPAGGLTRLKHIEAHTFRRIRDDDTLGEEFVFEVDSEGEVLRMRRNYNVSQRLRP